MYNKPFVNMWQQIGTYWSLLVNLTVPVSVKQKKLRSVRMKIAASVVVRLTYSISTMSSPKLKDHDGEI